MFDEIYRVLMVQLYKDIELSERILAAFDKWIERLFPILLLACVMQAQTAEAASSISAAWANDGEDKVTQDELRLSQAGKNVVNPNWDGTTIKIAGAKTR